MRCGKCGTGFTECTCKDADERLKKLAYDPKGMITFKWCRTCDKHYARCKCGKPDFYAIHRGKEIQVSLYT